MAYPLLNNVVDGLTDVLLYCTPVVAMVFFVAMVIRSNRRKHQAMQAGEDVQSVDEAITRADALERFSEESLQPEILSGKGLSKETYLRDMLSTVRRIRADLLPMREQAMCSAPLDARQRKALNFACKELDRCLHNLRAVNRDSRYAQSLYVQMSAADIKEKEDGEGGRKPRAPRYRPAGVSFARTANTSGSASSDDDWINPLNPLSPFSPLNPLAALNPLYSAGSWSGGQSESRNQDDGERRYGNWRESGGPEISSVFSCRSDGGEDDDSRRTRAECNTWSDTSSNSDDGGSSNDSCSDGGSGGDCGGDSGGGGGD